MLEGRVTRVLSQEVFPAQTSITTGTVEEGAVGAGSELAAMIGQIGRKTSLLRGEEGRVRVGVSALVPGVGEEGLEDGGSHLVEDDADHLQEVVPLADGEGLPVDESVGRERASLESTFLDVFLEGRIDYCRLL